MTQLPAIVSPAPEPRAELSGLMFLPKAVPRDLAASADRNRVLAECRTALDATRPATQTQFAVILEKLWLHYPEHRLDAAEQKLVKQDWWRLMGHLPADILQAAADAYVLSPARFAPTPGQLLALVVKPMSYRKALADRARETLELIQQQVAN